VAQALVDQLSPFVIAGQWPAVEMYGMFWALDALGAAGRTTEALNLIREQYGALLDQGATTWYEVWAAGQKPGQSLSHAWGGAPTWFLSAHVLGATATGPASWRAAPHPGGLAWVRGAVPMAGGAIEVEWRQEGCGQVTMTVAAPQGTTGEIGVPLWNPKATVILDGAPIWEGGPASGLAGAGAVQWTAEGLQIAGVPGGAHDITATFACYQAFLPLAAGFQD
jgi:hypothetical protein